MHGLLLVCLLIGTWIVWTSLSLFRNYQIARKIGLPIVLSPVSSLNPIWILTYKVLFPSIISFLRSLPVGRWPRCTYMGWQYDEKYQIHQELGPAFVLCTPSLNEVFIADSGTVHHVLAKRKDFIKPASLYEGLNAFGRNLDTVEGETWQRHRRLTAPNFNERVSATVWSEAVRQSSQMLSEWMATNHGNGTRETVDDTAALALNVLAYAGFGTRYDFKQLQFAVESSHTLSYREALQRVLKNFTILAIFPMRSLHFPFLPASIKAIGEACEELKIYMRDTVNHEKQRVAHGESTNSDAGHDIESHNLLTALVRSSLQAEDSRNGLTNEELYGNIFIYNLAGHETTANTIATAIAYLAAAPKWQDWLYEELESVLPRRSESVDARDCLEVESDYERVFPLLNRACAVMLETLRLHGSLPFIPKITAGSQVLAMDGTNHVVPADTFIVVNSQAVHCDPKVWGSDALVWRPDRWIIAAGNDGNNAVGARTSDKTVALERIFEPADGSFVPWADGPRVCPGRKFSQVEFVGVIVALFRDHYVVPRAVEGDDSKVGSAQEQLQSMIDDSSISAITLQMNRPRDVVLKWTKR